MSLFYYNHKVKDSAFCVGSIRMSYFGDHWYPCFGFLVMSNLGFKVRVASALFALQRQMY